MASRHLSIRIDQATFAELEFQARRSRETISELARRLITEGLRMEAHPGIVFRPGPTGRRAALIDGPDVWEIIDVFRDWDDPEAAVDAYAGATSVKPPQIRTALRYFAAYPEEIEERIKLNREEAERGYAAWLRDQRTGA